MAAAQPMTTLTTRRDFVAVAKRGAKAPRRTLVLQALRQRPPRSPACARIGVTATKKLGGAVLRNRVKRRLRALARERLSANPPLGWDLVLIGRMDTATCPWPALQRDFDKALAKIGIGRDRQNGVSV